MHANTRKGAALAAFLLLVAIWSAVLVETASATEWSKWKAPKQASYYTELGATASGRTIKPGSKFVAVDMSRVVSKKRWLKGSEKFRSSHWYYGQRIQIQSMSKKKKPVTVTVADCGSFGWAGQYWKGKYRPRWFDLTNSARKAVGLKASAGVCVVRWRYQK